MSVDDLLISQVILPITISLFSGILMIYLSKISKHIQWMEWMVLILATAIISLCLVDAYKTPRLVIVPDVRGAWCDRAIVLCKDVGLMPLIKISPYTSRVEANKVLEQSVSHGAEVFRGTKIILTVSRGEATSSLPSETNKLSKSKEESKK